MTRLGFDADGVLVASCQIAWRSAERIRKAFGLNGQIASADDLERLFGHAAQDALVGRDHAASLRMMHRLLMRYEAPRTPLFEDVLATVAGLPIERVLVTAALADGIRVCLGEWVQLFDTITGFETDRKPSLLAGLKGHIAAYVTDTVADIRMCHDLGIPAIACGWGYDGRDRLLGADPMAVVDTPDELAALIGNIIQEKELRHDHD